MKSKRAEEFIKRMRLDRGNAEFIVVANDGKLHGGLMRHIKMAVELAEEDAIERAIKAFCTTCCKIGEGCDPQTKYPDYICNNLEIFIQKYNDND